MRQKIILGQALFLNGSIWTGRLQLLPKTLLVTPDDSLKLGTVEPYSVTTDRVVPFFFRDKWSLEAAAEMSPIDDSHVLYIKFNIFSWSIDLDLDLSKDHEFTVRKSRDNCLHGSRKSFPMSIYLGSTFIQCVSCQSIIIAKKIDNIRPSSSPPRGFNESVRSAIPARTRPAPECTRSLVQLIAHGNF